MSALPPVLHMMGTDSLLQKATGGAEFSGESDGDRRWRGVGAQWLFPLQWASVAEEPGDGLTSFFHVELHLPTSKSTSLPNRFPTFTTLLHHNKVSLPFS